MVCDDKCRIIAKSASCSLVALLAPLLLVAHPYPAFARDIPATPATYRELIASLRPGDRLELASGTYRLGLSLRNLHGTAAEPIVIAGPPDRSADFLGRAGASTVELRDVSYVEIRNLTLDGNNTPGIDGVKSHDVTHHITLDNLEIINHGTHQQQVAISTKAPAWNWTIRNCIIRGAGTGLYLGDSDGSAPFVRGVIEHNVITRTIGYGLQIKHQNPRPTIPGLPRDRSVTVIRHNVISKARQPVQGYQGARPNLLVGHFPPSGRGVEDTYEIYGNILYQNLVDEALFQGEGNISFHNNLLVNHHGDGIWIQAHNDKPRRISVFHNTIVARGLGIAVRKAYPQFPQRVVGNAVLARTPIEAPSHRDNFRGSYAFASRYLKRPFSGWSGLDLRPLPGRLKGPPIDLSELDVNASAARDFAGNPRDGTVRGAYAGSEVPRYGPHHFPAAL